MAIFPFLAAPESKPAVNLPLLVDYAMDFDAGSMQISDGMSRKVSGLEALKVWIYKCLLTAKGRFMAYSDTFGSEIEDLIGGVYSQAAAQAEAHRMVSEALLQSPYITAIDLKKSALDGVRFYLEFDIDSVYGNAAMEVTV